MIRDLSGGTSKSKVRNPGTRRQMNGISLSGTHKNVQKCARQQRFPTGFTLVELLVVIAVIALLLAILFPALRKARQIAQRIACCSNLKQLALGWGMYLDEYDGYFYKKVNANLYYGGWRGDKDVYPRPLNRFLSMPEDIETEHSAKVFCCPADCGGTPNYAAYTKVYRHSGTSYITNFFLIGQDACGAFSSKTQALDKEISKRLPKLNVNRVDNPSRLLLMGDYGWWEEFDPGGDLGTRRPELKELAEWHGRKESHNLAFLDGHADFLEIRKGFYVTDEYCVLPFQDLYGLAVSIQGSR